MHIYLMRHAEKDLSVGGNPPLSPRGYRQAQSLVEHFKIIPQSSHLVLLASPKIRTQQTLEPLMKARNAKMKIVNELTERTNMESHMQFQKRIEKFLSQLNQQSNSHFVVCTHSDWLDVALNVLPMDVLRDDPRLPQFFATTQYLHFELVDELWRFIGQGTGN